MEQWCGASRSAREREPDRKVGAGCVLGSEREWWGVWGSSGRRRCLGAKRAPGCSRGTKRAGAAGSRARGVREVVEKGGDVQLGAGRVGMQVRARMLARRSAKRWGRRGRAHLSPEEMRAVVEATSPMGTCSFLVDSFCRIRGIRTDACASGLGAWTCWIRRGRRWIARCAGIAAAEGKCYGIAAQRVVAGIGSSKLVAADPGISAAAPRY